MYTRDLFTHSRDQLISQMRVRSVFYHTTTGQERMHPHTVHQFYQAAQICHKILFCLLTHPKNARALTPSTPNAKKSSC